MTCYTKLPFNPFIIDWTCKHFHLNNLDIIKESGKLIFLSKHWNEFFTLAEQWNIFNLLSACPWNSLVHFVHCLKLQSFGKMKNLINQPFRELNQSMKFFFSGQKWGSWYFMMVKEKAQLLWRLQLVKKFYFFNYWWILSFLQLNEANWTLKSANCHWS